MAKELLCLNCARIHTNKMFCSVSCALIYRHSKNKQDVNHIFSFNKNKRSRMEKVCKRCKIKPAKVKYCSDSCRYADANERKREVKAKKQKKIYARVCEYLKCDTEFKATIKLKRFCCTKCRDREFYRKSHPDHKPAVEPKIISKEKEFKKMMKPKIKCYNNECSGETWKHGGYCFDCIQSGKIKKKEYGEAKSRGVNTIDMRCQII